MRSRIHYVLPGRFQYAVNDVASSYRDACNLDCWVVGLEVWKWVDTFQVRIYRRHRVTPEWVSLRYLEALDEDAKATLLALKAAMRLRNDYDLAG